MKNTLEAQIGDWLRRRGLKLVVAESCTGGLIGHRITNIPGSSEYFLGGIVAYSYEAKECLLGVPHETIVRFGAVSSETVIEMARGARRILASSFPFPDTIGLAVSGIAGPGGGMPEKPVGLVWIGLSTPEGDQTWKFIWNGNRLENKEQSAQAALQILFDYLRGQITI